MSPAGSISNLTSEDYYSLIENSLEINFSNVLTANFIEYKNTTYKENYYLIVENDNTYFYKIKLFLNVNGETFVMCYPVIIKGFDEHFQAYEVGSKCNILKIKTLKSFYSLPHNLHTINNGKTYLKKRLLGFHSN